MELQSLRARARRLILEAELGDFVRSEQRGDDIEAGVSPGPHLVLQPVAAPRPRKNAEPARPGPGNPIDFSRHRGPA
jgi:hypothetical protein